MAGSSLACSMTRIGRPTSQEDFSHEPPTTPLTRSSPLLTYERRVHREISDNVNLDFDHTHGDISSEYIILGPNLRFFRCSRTWQGDVAATNSSDFEDYEEISDLFTEHDVERPPFLYLGPNKFFYTRVEDGSEMWKLSSEITRNGLEVTSVAVRSAAESLWLGVGGAWVAQYRDSRFRFDLKGHYAGLKKALQRKQEEEVTINALALNVTDGNSFACVFNDGHVAYEAGVAGFDGDEFEHCIALKDETMTIPADAPFPVGNNGLKPRPRPQPATLYTVYPSHSNYKPQVLLRRSLRCFSRMMIAAARDGAVHVCTEATNAVTRVLAADGDAVMVAAGNVVQVGLDEGGGYDIFK
ncbi:hypothetical protein F66182_10497 [Fusarium sp. NRRL 66182]|nr:hypothetical protein F66182_10497 [Fusarium sp. NRRL 66182]